MTILETAHYKTFECLVQALSRNHPKTWGFLSKKRYSFVRNNTAIIFPSPLYFVIHPTYIRH